MSDIAQRASDADRDDAITKLNSAFTLGYLTQEERDERVALAFTAKTEDELPPLLADIKKMKPPAKVTSMGPPQLEVYRQQIAELQERLARKNKDVIMLVTFLMGMVVFLSVHSLFGLH